MLSSKQRTTLLAIIILGVLYSGITFASQAASLSIKVDERFRNTNAGATPQGNGWKIFWRFMTDNTEGTEPVQDIPVVRRDKTYFNPTKPGDVRITWLGHAAMLIEIEGMVILTDPAFSERASPVQWMGPKRFHPVPISIGHLPSIDIILISHDHYDHLDYDSVLELDKKTAQFHVPLGIKARLIDWGINKNKIVEYDWWDEKPVNHLKLVATPAQHFSGRTLTDRNTTLWTSWAIIGKQHRIYFSGDTGMFDGFKEIGDRLGPFDYTLMHIGAYADLWQSMHMTPEEAVVAHRQLRGKFFLPIHWGTFKLAFHPWNEPADRLLAATRNVDFKFFIPKPGEFVSSSRQDPKQTGWWIEKQ